VIHDLFLNRNVSTVAEESSPVANAFAIYLSVSFLRCCNSPCCAGNAAPRAAAQRKRAHAISSTDTSEPRKTSSHLHPLFTTAPRPVASRLGVDCNARACADDVLWCSAVHSAEGPGHVFLIAECGAAHGRGDAVLCEFTACEGYQGCAEGGRRWWEGGTEDEEG